MKIRYITLLASTAVLALSSCKKFLDVNENPNSPTSGTPELVLPQAITATANNVVGYNTYGAWQVGYTSNAGGFGGFGSQLTYNYDQLQYNNLWSGPYNILEDYKFVLDETEGKDEYSYYNAAAKIMSSYLWQLLVDEYNDIPYSEALLGTANTSPAYDAAEDVYVDIYNKLNEAVATINAAQFPRPFKNSLGNADPLFNDNMTRWKQLANTLKLKLLVRASGTGALNGVTVSFDPAGFLTDDAIINPGFSNASGKQNPHWQAYHSSFAPTAGNARSIIANSYVVAFYNGATLDDEWRARAIYRGGIAPAKNQTGIQDGNPAAPANGPVWFSGNGVSFAFSDNPDGSETAKSAIGVLKGRNMGEPLILAAESYFLQAEARMKGILTEGDDVATLFNKGVVASFRYLYKNATNVVAANPLGLTDYAGDAANYIAENAGNANGYLVDITQASDDAERLEAIITQKYIALNMIHGHEAWAEFRRTGYPTIDNTTPFDEDKTFVSILTQASTPDKLPGRVLYPASEHQLNSENVPNGITVFGSYVFWDRRN